MKKIFFGLNIKQVNRYIEGIMNSHSSEVSSIDEKIKSATSDINGLVSEIEKLKEEKNRLKREKGFIDLAGKRLKNVIDRIEKLASEDMEEIRKSSNDKRNEHDLKLGEVKKETREVKLNIDALISSMMQLLDEINEEKSEKQPDEKSKLKPASNVISYNIKSMMSEKLTGEKPVKVSEKGKPPEEVKLEEKPLTEEKIEKPAEIKIEKPAEEPIEKQMDELTASKKENVSFWGQEDQMRKTADGMTVRTYAHNAGRELDEEPSKDFKIKEAIKSDKKQKTRQIKPLRLVSSGFWDEEDEEDSEELGDHFEAETAISATETINEFSALSEAAASMESFSDEPVGIKESELPPEIVEESAEELIKDISDTGKTMPVQEQRFNFFDEVDETEHVKEKNTSPVNAALKASGVADQLEKETSPVEKARTRREETLENSPGGSRAIANEINSIRSKYIVGKLAGEDLIDSEGRLIVAKNEKITVQIIEKAEREGKLSELITNMLLPGME